MVEGELLERDAAPAVLEQATDAAEDRRGSVVLVAAETGIGGTAGLTPRQTAVFELLAAGLTSARIAHHLAVSLRTVEHQVSAVLQDLGVRSRQQAAARAEEVLSP